MGIYVVTGGSKGIGEATVARLRSDGHTVVSIARKNSDLNADLGTPEGRKLVIDGIHARFPDGIDGLVSNAGIAFAKPVSRVLSVNFFGAVAVMEGLFDLLKKKHGRVCCVTSASLAYGGREGDKYWVDNLLVNCGDEERICALMDSFDPAEVHDAPYRSTKSALVRWVRRTAPGWAVKGVILNALAPGAVDTSIMEDATVDGQVMMGGSPEDLLAYVIPPLYGQNRIQPPDFIAQSIVYLLSERTHGLCGSVLICDSGTATVLHSEKYY
jgi:NAD(P)-dependent dehydrogenase (short-subunit alcohol dehydrogenase family)